jgi:hypothetical protein
VPHGILNIIVESEVHTVLIAALNPNLLVMDDWKTPNFDDFTVIRKDPVVGKSEI